MDPANVGRRLGPTARASGSIILIRATNLPLSARSPRDLTRHSALSGVDGRTAGCDRSRDLFLALSTPNTLRMLHEAGVLVTTTELNGDVIDPVYLAAVEPVEDAAVNALAAGGDVETAKPAGMVCRGIDVGRLKGMFGGG